MTIQFDRVKWSQDNEGFWLSLRVKIPQFAKDFVSNMLNKLYVADIKEYREKRSRDANSYFWVLIGKLAAVLHASTTDLYREYIREIGDNFQIVPIRSDAAEQWIKNWKLHGKGWVCEELCESKLEGYKNIICYYGSSTYDTLQMSRLIELLVQDCKEQGIETMTPDELSRLTNAWGE
jgi:AraC-like DNA-binding protein